MKTNIIQTQKNACIVYDTKLVLCKNGYFELKKYDKKLMKVKKGYEQINKEYNIKIKKKIESSNNEISTRNLTRTRDKIIKYACENESLFHSFITLTLSDKKENKLSTDIDINDISQANKLFNIWTTQMRRKYKDFVYLCVPEYQKRGAIHYHLLSSLKCDIDIPKLPIIKTYNKEKNKYYELEYYNIKYWNYGFSTAFNIDMTDNNFNVALYITKYLYKDIDNRLYGHQKCMVSKTLQEPKTIYLNSMNYQFCLDYIKEKGYNIDTYEFTPNHMYQVPFTKSTTTISQLDYNIMNMTLDSSYRE